jgi:hypothetical protein
MMDTKPDAHLDPWTDEQKKMLAHEAFVAEVLKQRSATKPDEPPKSKLMQFFESASGAALITALVGGLLVQLIAVSIQRGIKEREFQQAWMKDVVRSAYTLVGKSVGASEDLMLLTTDNFDPDKYPKGKDRDLVEKQRVLLKEQYNDADREWRRQQEALALLIGFYHRDDPKPVMDAWEEQGKAVSDFMDCAREFHLRNRVLPPGQREDPSKACLSQKDQVKAETVFLTERLSRSRPVLARWWEFWKD